MRIGILGGGQLARMLALAGHRLGLEFTVLDPSVDACAGAVAKHIVGAYDDEAKLTELAQWSDVITYEFENVPATSLSFLEESVPIYPNPNALAVSRDRLKEKTLFTELDIPTPAFFQINSQSDLENAAAELGLPGVLKTRTLGYDGKGQTVLRTKGDVKTAWEELGKVPCILESLVRFSRELSVIAVRGRNGETAFYPVSENTHKEGILRYTFCRPNESLQETAQEYSKRILDKLDYTGVLALELFEEKGKLFANETATRVHNSGHWSMDGAYTSQFENHIRAVSGLPLGSTDCRCYSAMVNIIGTRPEKAGILGLKNAFLHDYTKSARPGRKIGHVNICAQDEKDLDRLFAKLQDIIIT
ncbi:MAG: 5-(carboxyamino)imidazole ribonucleotide synthase [Spirochaetia bacterium]